MVLDRSGQEAHSRDMSNDQRLAHYAALESEARNDLPYVWGQTITTRTPGPFSTRQLARLMILKSKIAERGCWS